MQHNKRPVAWAIFPALVFTAALWGAATAQAAERQLSLAVSGIIVKILVTAGQSVKAGQALAELDTSKIRARLKAAKAAQAAAKIAHDIAARRFDYAAEQFEAISLSKLERDEAELAKAEAQAKLSRIESRMDIANWRLAQMTLRAPKAGRIAKVLGYRGMVVSLRAAVTPVIVIEAP